MTRFCGWNLSLNQYSAQFVVCRSFSFSLIKMYRMIFCTLLILLCQHYRSNAFNQVSKEKEKKKENVSKLLNSNWWYFIFHHSTRKKCETQITAVVHYLCSYQILPWPCLQPLAILAKIKVNIWTGCLISFSLKLKFLKHLHLEPVWKNVFLCIVVVCDKPNFLPQLHIGGIFMCTKCLYIIRTLSWIMMFIDIKVK